MKVAYNWLKEFVEVKTAPRVLADKLTMAGLEVTSLEEKEGDFILELEVTANRPDCLSVIGITREVAAITGKKLKLGSRLSVRGYRSSTKNQKQNSEHRNLEIKIENKKDCPLYTATLIKNVRVGPSPDWLKRRLELVGCRSVNNVVDITNYILFEWGEPLHAFDLDKLSQGSIFVRRGKHNERLVTIDGEDKMLNPDILVIADKERPVAIAGIMGGKDTEVTEKTRSVLLEAAAFNPLIIRRARQNLGLKSESAYRFERGVDLEIVKIASSWAAELIHRIAGGECVLRKDCGVTKVKKRRISLDVAVVPKILGANITAPKIKSILNNLGFKVMPKVQHKNWQVEVPAYRQDVNGKIDLIEEIARIYGYEHIPKTLPKLTLQIDIPAKRDIISLVKNILTGLGLNEVITYSLINKDLLKDGAIETAIEILNPLSKEQEILRPTIIPSLLNCLASNLNQKQSRINIFEIAKVFSATSGKPQEKLVLGIAFEQDLSKQEAGFLHLKGILEILFERLGIKDYSFRMIDCAQVAVDLAEEKLGIMARPPDNILGRFDIKNKDVFVAELSLDGLLPYANLKKRFSSPPVYPGISRDISLILKEDIKAGDILKAIKEQGAPLLRDLKLVDYYRGQQIPAGFKGLTISCLYRLDERTLTEAEIEPLHSLLYTFLTERFSAKIRS